MAEFIAVAFIGGVITVVAMALTSGVIPRRIEPKIKIGRVVTLPLTKLAIT